VKQLRLYHRDGCHLCEEMAEQLEALRHQVNFNYQLIDVESDEAVRAHYHERVPVLEGAEGNLLSEVYFDPVSVLSYLREV
jgi:glutaredoxin